ncbi:hypothetical protein EYF80_067214 [Liparis tanakae]|uniref:Uncharacterized protein n=1 Tax=Liparis tanakae TaxID=230148 RepID=A0A4Z2E1M9_9TELE|nr:hypothetical protein EYF80_067214 [Liparis tanakae]
MPPPRHRVPAAAVLQEEVLQRAAAQTQELGGVQQPGPVRRRGAGRLLLGLQHHAHQGLEDRRAGGRAAGRPAAARLHRLLRQQGQPAARPVGRLPGQDERQRPLMAVIHKSFRRKDTGPLIRSIGPAPER